MTDLWLLAPRPPKWARDLEDAAVLHARANDPDVDAGLTWDESDAGEALAR